MIQTILHYLIFLPNVVPPIGWISSDTLSSFPIETFPWALFFCFHRKLVIDKLYIVLMLVFAASTAITIARYGQFTNSIRSYLAFLNASLIFYRIIGADKEEFLGLIKAILVIFILNYVVSILQYVDLFPEIVADVYKIFVPRFSAESEAGGGRGVYGLFAEPAYSANFMHFMFAFIILWWRLSPFEWKGTIAFSAMLLFDLVLNKSGTSIVLLAILFMSFLEWKHLWRTLVVGLVGLFLVAYASREMDDPPRAIQLVNNIFFTPETDDLFLTVLNESGFRLIGVMAGYLYGFVHIFGGGIGSWPVSSVVAMEMTGIESFEIYYYLEFNDGFYLGIRPTAFAAALFLEAGLAGFSIFSYVFFKNFIAIPYRQNPFWRAVLNLFLFYFFCLGIIGDPTPFIMIAMSFLALTVYPISESAIDQGAGTDEFR